MGVELGGAGEGAGADGILVLPPYLVKAEQAGLFAHLDAICRATRLAVIPYNRDNCIIAPDTLARLAERHANLIRFKHRHGDVEQLVLTRQTLGDRLVYIRRHPPSLGYPLPHLPASSLDQYRPRLHLLPRL